MFHNNGNRIYSDLPDNDPDKDAKRQLLDNMAKMELVLAEILSTLQQTMNVYQSIRQMLEEV